MDSNSQSELPDKTRIRQQEVVADIGQRALETGNLDQLLSEASVAIAETLNTDYCTVVELLPGGDEGILRQGFGWQDELLGDATVTADSDSEVGYTLHTEEPITVEDLGTDERFSRSELFRSHDIVSALSVTIWSEESPWGVLGVYTTECREFSERDSTFVQQIADILSSAIDHKRRERELHRKERRYEAMFEDPNILVGLLDLDGTVLDINGTAMEYIDADLDEVTGVPFWETPWWTGGDGISEKVEEWVERAADGEYVDFEAELTRPNDERYFISGYFRPVTDDDGDVVSIIVSDRDITERKERQRKLEESEQRYRALVEHFPNGAVALVDEDLYYTTGGGEPLDAAGVTAEEMVGKSVREVVPPELSELVSSYETALEGESSAFEVESNGRVYQLRVVPVRDSDGDIFAALGMSQDVTELVETQRKLAETEQRYRTLVEHFPNGSVGLFNENLEYTAVGGQLLDELDLEPEDRIGRSIRELHPDELIDEIEPYFEAALEGETNAFEIEYRGRHLSAHTLPIRNADDEVYAGMLVVQDVTERREYEHKLEESNERLEQFAYAASHDLQEPLRMVSSYLQLIENRYADALDEDGKEFLEFAAEGADRMRNMIDGLLQYSRVDTRGDSFAQVDLDAVFEDVLQDLQVKIEESDAEITTEELPQVYGDGSQLNQVFQNLLSNAIEYSGDEPPRIHISAERAEGEWVISVADEGIGIDAENTERVFEVFQSLHTQDANAGTGIGLALCERIVERHGGDIWVESEPGEGATFSFTLPVVGNESNN